LIITTKKKGGGAMLSGFGQHPNFKKNYDVLWKQLTFDNISPSGFRKIYHTKLSSLKDPRHPDAYLIRRDYACLVVDEWDDPIALFTHKIPFSSYDIYLDIENEESIFYELYHTPAIWRLGGVSQLGYLVPMPPEGDEDKEIFYTPRIFHHSRYDHSMIVVALAEIILARNGFSEKERAPFILACACHDIATPAGGDSVMRIDKKELDEEKNFSYILKRDGLDIRWKEKYGFNLMEAQGWIEGKGLFGSFLNVLDRLAYVSLDCYWFGHESKNKIRSFVSSRPLIMDILQDIRFTDDKTQFYFCDKERLYDFLTLRVLEHTELLLNPRSRALDHTLFKHIKGLYDSGQITKEKLLMWDDDVLNRIVMDLHETSPRGFFSPDKFEWRFFQSERLMEIFCNQNRDQISHVDRIKKLNVGFDWPVQRHGEVVEIGRVLANKKIKKLDSIANSLQGWYVYLYKKEKENK
jgi:hypothetical protein